MALGFGLIVVVCVGTLLLRILKRNTKFPLFMGLLESTKETYAEIRNESHTKYAVLGGGRNEQENNCTDGGTI